jgi:hypothetical protein
MTVIARRFVASPVRSSSECWAAISSAIAAQDAAATAEFDKVCDIAASLINTEVSASEPIVVSGAGPRLKVYCLFGDDAMDGEDASEESLTWNPFAQDWKVYMPCPKDELKWMVPAVAKVSDRFELYDADDGYKGDLVVKSEAAALDIDMGGLRNL